MEGLEATRRDESMSQSSIDEDYIVSLVKNTWDQGSIQREANAERRQLYQDSWRQLTTPESRGGPWENSANFHVPLTFTFGKAIHARLWQVFSSPNGFFKVEARNESFTDREDQIKHFMDWVIYDFCNNGIGAKRELDKWLWDVVFEGSGYLKCYWKKSVQEYREIVPVVKQEEILSIAPGNLTGATSFRTSVSEEEQDIIKEVETPQIRRILWDDVMLPLGQTDPQDSDHVITRVYMSNEDLKWYAEQKLFFPEAVKQCLGDTNNPYLQPNAEDQIKQQRAEIDGYEPLSEINQSHTIYEYYGPAYVVKKMFSEQELDEDLDTTKREIVAWVHRDQGKVLGWTYLNRVSPSGIRPIFKADFITIPDRADGVGAPEVLYDIGRYTDAVHNLKFDNGTLASIPMFAYRNSSNSLKALTYRMQPGGGLPVDDINDIKAINVPYLGQFGTQETQELFSYAERALSVNELNMGGLPSKVGALRNATGSNLISQESSIQLEPHFDRIAHCMNRLLQFLFKLCRERMPEELVFRVTGEKGEPIFGKVNRKDLEGDFDFRISVDILGQSQIEKQQKAVLAMQTLINPVFTQQGIVTPDNLFNLAANFVRTQRLGRISDFVTQPATYQGPKLSPSERIYRIVTGNYMQPPIEGTVRLDENHEEALNIYKGFKDSESYGLLSAPGQLAALEQLIAAHEQLLVAQQAGGAPNMAGTQVPRDGFGAVDSSMGGGGETLQTSDPSTPNGPVV